METWNALVDPDIQPIDILRDAVTPTRNLEISGSKTESALIRALD